MAPFKPRRAQNLIQILLIFRLLKLGPRQARREAKRASESIDGHGEGMESGGRATTKIKRRKNSTANKQPGKHGKRKGGKEGEEGEAAQRDL